jgi:hypothetical protein
MMCVLEKNATKTLRHKVKIKFFKKSSCLRALVAKKQGELNAIY